MATVQIAPGWWDRCLISLGLRSDQPVDDDSFAWEDPERSENGLSLADVPQDLKERLQKEVLRSTFHRLENQLRFLLRATFQEDDPDERDEAKSILWLWRQGLEQEVHLRPETYPGAVQTYSPEMADSYFVPSQCQVGEPLRIVTPCWKLDDDVVVRGEAEPYEEQYAPEAAATAS